MQASSGLETTVVVAAAAGCGVEALSSAVAVQTAAQIEVAAAQTAEKRNKKLDLVLILFAI